MSTKKGVFAYTFNEKSTAGVILVLISDNCMIKIIFIGICENQKPELILK